MAFDLERYQWRSQKLDLTGIEWERARDHPLPPEAIRALIYMMDIEGHTSVYLSELLVSKACMDPEITGFLHVWAYEEMFHSMALRTFLDAYGAHISHDHQATFRRRTNAKRIRTTLAVMLASHAVEGFAAVYLTIGAINELSTLWGYQLLAQKTQHPVLEDLLARIAKQERKHYAFYRHQAERRLGSSRVARAITRRYLETHFVAVGAGEKARRDVDDVALYLFGDTAGRRAAERIDEEMGRLPGLERTSLVRNSVARAGRRLSTHGAAQRLTAVATA